MLSPHERFVRLFDPGSWELVGRSRDGGVDGVETAVGHVRGRRVACYSQDGARAGGAVGGAEADAIVRLLELAGSSGAPVVGFVHSAGAMIQDGVGGLAGFARIFAAEVALLRRVPQISVVTGPSAGGGAYSTALTDFVVMTEDAAMFLTGPTVLSRACGEHVSAHELGGPRVHARNGVCHLVARDDAAAIAQVRALLDYLSDGDGERPIAATEAPGAGTDPAEHLPDRRGAPYDVRAVARDLVDGGELLELAPAWSPNMFTAFARVGGTAVGVVANQPRHLGGVIDGSAAVKAARFVAACDAYRLPLVVLVDTPGFLPGSKQEREGIIFRGARLVEAFVRATVPSVTVVLRKAYGGAYIAMNAKHLGATLTLTWPGAEIGIMDAREAVSIVHRRTLTAAAGRDELAATLAADYAEAHCDAAAAVRRGFVDRIVEPSETAAELRRALARPSVPLAAALSS